MENLDINEVNKLDKKIHDYLPESNTKGSNPVDTFLKYSPFILLLILHREGFKTKSRFKKFFLKMLIGTIMLEIASNVLKASIKRVRPNGQPHSFPSLHTATCIFGAEILRSELKENYPGVSSSGYVISAITALLRMYHNKHWFSDIVAGALLGLTTYKLTSAINFKENDEYCGRNRIGPHNKFNNS